MQRSVALLIETSNAYCRGLLRGIGAYIQQRAHWSVHLNEQERGADPPAWLEKWKVDGIIARIETDRIGHYLKKLNVPIVDLSAARHLPGIPWADTEDKAISAIAAEHFLDRGFDHLAFCGDTGFAWSNSRRDHFRYLAQQANCAFFDHAITHRYSPDYEWNEVRSKLGEWLQQLPRPIGIMACNDYVGQLLLDVCRSMDISTPEEIAVLGVDNDELICEFCEPQLSSVIPDTYRTGFEAALLLEQMMNNEQIDSEVRLVTKPLGIQLRTSTDTIALQDPEIAKALAYIRRNAMYNIKVGDVLQHINISRRALEHRFVKLVGHTPHEEITRIRTLKVKQLLANSEDSILEIAQRAGYEHPEYFSASFRKVTGETPSQYRDRIRRESNRSSKS